MRTIAIDAVGGDHGLSVSVPAALWVLSQYPTVRLCLVGNAIQIEHALAGHAYPQDRLRIVHASQRVEMDELPSLALRNKKDSSMRVAIDLVKEGTCQACVSAGNTGALMATARFVLKTLPGIDRPAIISSFPTISGGVMRMLDLGANVDVSGEQLFQFAVMGSVLISSLENKPKPNIRLLNIGEEEMKGNDNIKEAARLLNESPFLNYTGYIEGNRLYFGDADLVVADGFIGNVALKTTEGVAVLMGKLLKQAFMENTWTRFIGLLAKPILKPLAKRIDPARYNGASLLGLKGIVIKSHGSTSVMGFAHAIEQAMHEIEKNIPERIRSEVEKILAASNRSAP